MQHITGPTDVIVDGHVVRVKAGQTMSFADYAFAEPTSNFDEYEAAATAADENGSTATFYSLGEEAAGHFSTVRKNPSLADAEFWSTYDSPATPWSYPINIHAGKNYSYEGGIYMAIQSHVSQVDWAPPAVTPTLYVVIPADSAVWEAGVSYAVDDVVTYAVDGLDYLCIQAHVSQVGWEPPNVPALWEPIGATQLGNKVTSGYALKVPSSRTDTQFIDPDGPSEGTLEFNGVAPSYFGTDGPTTVVLDMPNIGSTIKMWVTQAEVPVKFTYRDGRYTATIPNARKKLRMLRGRVVAMRYSVTT